MVSPESLFKNSVYRAANICFVTFFAVIFGLRITSDANFDRR